VHDDGAAVADRLGGDEVLDLCRKEADERLLRKALPERLTGAGGKTPAAVRLTAASPKVSPGQTDVGDRVGDRGGVDGTFREPGGGEIDRLSLTPSRASAVGLAPQHGSAFAERQSSALSPWVAVSHVSRPSTGLPPPLVKSKVISRSPAVRTRILDRW
jgi:hypothetical protein